MPDDFVETKRGGICGIMGDRYFNSKNNNNSNNSNNNNSNNNNNSSIWYIMQTTVRLCNDVKFTL